MFANILLAIVYLALAGWVFWWLAPRSRRLKMDHLNAAVLGLIWPLVLVWVLVVCANELRRPQPEED